MTTTPENHYDLIVIGSGMGALTVASLMAHPRDKRVLVIERHNRPGGYTHDFKRGPCHFDTGLHYLGQMRKGSMTRRMIDLITDGKVEWARMPDPFDTFVYLDLRFDVYAYLNRTIAALCDLFPDFAKQDMPPRFPEYGRKSGCEKGVKAGMHSILPDNFN